MAKQPIIPNFLDRFLTDEERGSGAWKSIHDKLVKKLQHAREMNDKNLGPRETDVLRGYIQLLKEMISLNNEPPQVVANDARPRPRVDLGAKYG